MACLSDLINFICRLWLAVFPIDPKIALREQSLDLLTREMGDSLVKEINYSLPSNTKPIEYVLNITPDLIKEEFKGHVLIEIEAIHDTNNVILHSRDLNIIDVTIEVINSMQNIEPDTKLDKNNGILIISTKKKQMFLAGCKYRVLIRYNGRMSNKTSFGFVKHTFMYDRITESKKTYMASTLLEPIFARKLLPCYDEPKYKTPITLAIRKHSYQKVISNMHVDYEYIDKKQKSLKDDLFSSMNLNFNKSSNDDGVWVIFVKSKPIPICQLAFAIVNDDFGERTQGGEYVDYSAWTMKDALNQVSFSMNHAEKTILKLEKLTNTRPLTTKFNLIQMQGTVKETRWDSIFYMQDRFLSDENSCSQKNQQDTVVNITRQLSYEWFSNYIFVETWHYPWLKDGFAVYLSYKLNEMINPNWRMTDHQATVDMQKVLYQDGRYFIRPLTHHTGEPSPNDIIPLYQLPTFEIYNGKAALIIRMLEHIVGESTFKNAIQRFLKIGHARGTVTPNILWEAFQTQVKEDDVDMKLPDCITKTIKSIMEPWTKNVGYPLITASLQENDGRIVITQTAYYGHRKFNDLPKSTWIIPITLATRINPDFTNTSPITWCVSDKRETILDIGLENNNWFLLNVQNTGYYRTNYSINNWELLIQQLVYDPTIIHPINRAQLLRDSHILAMDGHLPLNIPIRLSTYLVKENDPIVWMAALDQFKIFYSALSLTARPVYKEHFLACLRNEYNRIGFVTKYSDDRPTKIWRSEMLQFVCWLNDEACVKKAEKEYDKYEKQLLQIDPNFQFIILCTVLHQQNLYDEDTIIVRNMLSRIEKTSVYFLCEYKIFLQSINCAMDAGKYPDLAELIFKEMYEGDKKHIETYMRGILSHWDTTAFVLESIRDILLKWSWTEKPTSKECLENLMKAILYLNLYGEISGNPEVDILDEMIRWIDTSRTNVPENVRKEVKDALSDIRRKATRVGNPMDENELMSLFEMYRCTNERKAAVSKKKSVTFANNIGG